VRGSVCCPVVDVAVLAGACVLAGSEEDWGGLEALEPTPDPEDEEPLLPDEEPLLPDEEPLLPDEEDPPPPEEDPPPPEEDPPPEEWLPPEDDPPPPPPPPPEDGWLWANGSEYCWSPAPLWASAPAGNPSAATASARQTRREALTLPTLPVLPDPT
jgi:hypothetical protein